MEIFAALILGAFATFRLTKLIIEDQVAAPLREKLFEKNRPTLTYFLTCPWCVSIWVALLLVIFYVATPEIFYPLALLLSWSAITGIFFEKI